MKISTYLLFVHPLYKPSLFTYRITLYGTHNDDYIKSNETEGTVKFIYEASKTYPYVDLYYPHKTYLFKFNNEV